ncbi:hypothetical protein [Filimonas effusa]|uniref:BZIP transcription factor n=1 Tax=Filimonas effusa TaxID=2508721 RepID=A0A4Q1D3E5_9BACT|nr:hypothetical protein [Filimonas effusa]RXK82909.1 hypothetical protein ESB13_12330 [Filimonas effusa]
MKKVLSLVAFSFVINTSFAQEAETLHSVTGRGNNTLNSIRVTGDFNLSGGPAAELYYRNNVTYLSSYDRSNSILKPLVFQSEYSNFPNGSVGIGIGNAAPAAQLQVGGRIIVSSPEYLYGQLQILNPLDGEASFTLACNGTGKVISRTSYARQWTIGINAYASGMNNLAITNPVTLEKGFVFSYDGRLGIGTNNVSDAGYRLFVETGIRTRKIKVDHTTWADYVFDSSYQLAPLSYVEQFIQENKHLPEVPSAAEVKKDGLDLGDNQAVLLKKIEELTLYIIQQNKKMEQMEKRLAEVESKQSN